MGVKPHVLRYWEQEFTQLKPVKRRGNRRYYQHHEVLLIRRIRELLYEQGFTINGARNRLDSRETNRRDTAEAEAALADRGGPEMIPVDVAQLRGALLEILQSLGGERAEHEDAADEADEI